MRKINKIIIHCSDSDISSHDNIETIDLWHKARGWSGVGYHYFIRKSGLIERGRTVDQVGAHCAGENSDSIGICLSGKHDFKENQFRALAKLIKSLDLVIGKKDIFPHNFYNKGKTCPNFDIDIFITKYLI